MIVLKRNLLKILHKKSKVNSYFITIFLSLCIIFIFAEFTFAGSQDSSANSEEINKQRELTERLEELVEQLRLERSGYYTQKAQYDTQIKNARENHKILKEEVEELRLQENESDQQILKYKDEVKEIKKGLVAKTTLENVLQDNVQPFIQSQKKIIQEGIPYKQEERIECLETNSISTANQLENIWNYSLEELRIGRSSETYTARVKISDNVTPHARYFRVGQLILGFITEDGTQTAMWLSQFNENGFLITNDKKQSEQIRSAVEILDHHQPPEFIKLPVSLNLANAKEDSNASD